jgi:hypothetical protein
MKHGIDKDEFQQIEMSIPVFKVKNNEYFKKTVWIDKQFVFKKYVVTSDHQLEKFKKNFNIYKSLYNDFSFLIEKNIIFCKNKKIKSRKIPYDIFLLGIDRFIHEHCKVKNKFLCFEDLGPYNYFFNNGKIVLVDESKLSVTDNFEVFYVRTMYGLYNGLKYSKHSIHIGSNLTIEDCEKLIYNISCKIKNLKD